MTTTTTCDCCGGSVPSLEIWSANRDHAGECTGSVTHDGRCRAWADDDLWEIEADGDEAVRESAISREHARHILADADQEEEWDRLSDYWIVTTANGDEELWIHGCDEPEVVNRTTTSWLGSPPSHWTAERFAVEMRP